MTKSLISYNASHTLATLHSSFGSLFSIFAPNPHVLRAYKITVIATHLQLFIIHYSLFTIHYSLFLCRTNTASQPSPDPLGQHAH